MKLFKVVRKDKAEYEEPEGFIVRAENRKECMSILDERYDIASYEWTVTELKVEGKEEIILESWASA